MFITILAAITTMQSLASEKECWICYKLRHLYFAKMVEPTFLIMCGLLQCDLTPSLSIGRVDFSIQAL